MYTHIYILQSPIKIYKGLALEQVLFRECIGTSPENTQDNHSILFLWRSTPAVVIGRNQNPLLECNVRFLVENNIDLARRDSGGGAVYLDSQNLNFCCIHSQGNNVATNFSFVRSILSTLGIDCEVDSNNNLRYKGYKISGSAYRVSKSVHLHHFTLLLSTDLHRLRNSLVPSTNMIIESKGVASKKDKVINILLNTQELLHEIVSSGKKLGAQIYQEEETLACNPTLIEEEQNRLISHAWMYERTPIFVLECSIDEISYHVIIKKGILCMVRAQRTGEIIWEGHIPFFLAIMHSSQNSLQDTVVHDIIKKIKLKIIGEKT